MRICAGIVLYNPDIQRLEENVLAIKDQVEEVLLVDNASKNEKEIRVFLEEYKDLHYIRLEKNFGIAKALNHILKFAIDENYDAYVTLDQDSVCASQLIEKYTEVYKADIGQISCNIHDRNTGIMDKVDFENGDIHEIEHCITSGCINNTSAVKRCGGYNESLFIDGVDIELSCNLRKHGYRIICINYDGLLHEFGNGMNVQLLNKKLSAANHVPWRNYYTRRNMIYVAKRYYTGWEREKKVIKQIIYGIGAVILEDKKITRMKYNIQGIRDGIRKDLSRNLYDELYN